MNISFVLLLRAQKKNQEKGKKNDASTHGPPPSPPFFYSRIVYFIGVHECFAFGPTRKEALDLWLLLQLCENIDLDKILHKVNLFL